MPDVEGAAFALALRRRAVVPHRVVDDELVAPAEEVDERDRSFGADDLGASVDLDHGEPPTGRRDRVALAGVGLLSYQQLIACRLPCRQVDDRRLARAFAARVGGRRGHGGGTSRSVSVGSWSRSPGRGGNLQPYGWNRNRAGGAGGPHLPGVGRPHAARHRPPSDGRDAVGVGPGAAVPDEHHRGAEARGRPRSSGARAPDPARP